MIQQIRNIRYFINLPRDLSKRLLPENCQIKRNRREPYEPEGIIQTDQLRRQVCQEILVQCTSVHLQNKEGEQAEDEERGEKGGRIMNLSREANEWLRTGERGLSSEAIFSKLTGINILSPHPLGNAPHPYDPDDFQRCEKLLRAVPDFRARLNEMRKCSKEWNSLVENWDKIVTQFEKEVPGVFNGDIHNWSAPKTYLLMKVCMEVES